MQNLDPVARQTAPHKVLSPSASAPLVVAQKQDGSGLDLRRLHDYWEACRSDQCFPTRADIDPLDFAYALGQVSMVDVHQSPLRFFFRLDGSIQAQRHGIDLTGDWLGPESRGGTQLFLYKLFSDAVAAKAPLLRERKGADGHRYFDYQALVLPLGNGSNEIAKFLLAIDFKNRDKLLTDEWLLPRSHAV